MNVYEKCTITDGLDIVEDCFRSGSLASRAP